MEETPVEDKREEETDKEEEAPAETDDPSGASDDAEELPAEETEEETDTAEEGVTEENTDAKEEVPAEEETVSEEENKKTEEEVASEEEKNFFAEEGAKLKVRVEKVQSTIINVVFTDAQGNNVGGGDYFVDEDGDGIFNYSELDVPEGYKLVVTGDAFVNDFVGKTTELKVVRDGAEIGKEHV